MAVMAVIENAIPTLAMVNLVFFLATFFGSFPSFLR